MQTPVDFFDAASWGRLPESVSLESPPETVRFKHGLVEDFEFGWSRETTYNVYRAKVEQLLLLADEEHNDVAQTLLQAAIIFTVSGLESLVHLYYDRDQTQQDIDRYEKLLTAHPRFVTGPPADLAALRRLFGFRHAIVHAGSRVTYQLVGDISKRAPRNQPVLLAPALTRAVVHAADRFADRVEQILAPGGRPP